MSMAAAIQSKFVSTSVEASFVQTVLLVSLIAPIITRIMYIFHRYDEVRSDSMKFDPFLQVFPPVDIFFAHGST